MRLETYIERQRTKIRDVIYAQFPGAHEGVVAEVDKLIDELLSLESERAINYYLDNQEPCRGCDVAGGYE